MKRLLMLVTTCLLVGYLAALGEPTSGAKNLPAMSQERFYQIRSILKATEYPIDQPALEARLGGPGYVKWVFDSGAGKGADTRHYSYYATEPYVTASGGFCIEMEVATKGGEPTNTVVAARLCFVSRFGAIYYEKDVQ